MSCRDKGRTRRRLKLDSSDVYFEMPAIEGGVVAVQIHLPPTPQRTTAALAIYELQGASATTGTF